MVSFKDDWDKRLWYHPIECARCEHQLVARPQIDDNSGADVYYDALSGTMRAKAGREQQDDPAISEQEAARRLGISERQMQAWINQNNRIFRHRYEGTD